MIDAIETHPTIAGGAGSGPAFRQPLILSTALFGMCALLLAAAYHGGWRIGVGALLGAMAGLTLYQAAFGFASAWRHLIAYGRGGGVRAQLLLIALIIAFSFPLIGWGRDIGFPVSGWIFPFGVSAAIGAFLFGIGMQLGGGCGSGTLYVAGGGSTRMLITLAAFIAGSLLVTSHWEAWQGLPSLPAMSLIWWAGPLGALAIGLASLGLLSWASILWERRRHGALEPPTITQSFLHGRWSRAQGAILLAVMAVLTLIVIGRPWGITSAFALWGAKIAHASGVAVESWSYWQYSSALRQSVFADATSVMNFGILLGALMGASLAGKFAPVWQLPLKSALAAVLGGLLMGYGARLAFGCNIGAFLGGLTSGSLHGLGWMVFGLAGSAVGIPLRRRFGLN